MRLILMYPYLVLLFGPPLLRPMDARGAEASLQGSIDIWILVQIAVWGSAGGLALFALISRSNVSIFSVDRGVIFSFAALTLVASLLMSSLYSPNPTLTMVFSTLYGCAVVAALQLANGVASHRREDAVLTLIRFFRFACVSILVLIMGLFLVAPNYVAITTSLFGLRILGGSVGPAAIAALLAYVISVYFLANGLESRTKSVSFIVFTGLIIFFAKTRAVYFLFVLSTIILWAQWVLNNRNHYAAGVLIASSLLVLSVLTPITIANSDMLIQIFSRGSLETLTTGSGRTYIADWVIGRLVENPLGLGFIAGFRAEFIFLPDLGEADSVLVTNRIGNTHNSFLEILIGAGWHSFILFIALIWMTYGNLRRSAMPPNGPPAAEDIRHGVGILKILLLNLLILSIPNADFSIPGRATFSYLWFVLGTSLGVMLRYRQFRQSAAPRTVQRRGPGG